MKKNKKVYEDKVYRLTRDAAPLSYMLSSKHTKRKALLYFDEETGINRALRYARNQKSMGDCSLRIHQIFPFQNAYS